MHQTLLASFERMNADGDPWMSRASANDPDVILSITAQPREAASVYWFDHDDLWTSLSGTRIAGRWAGVFQQIFYDQIEDIGQSEPDHLLINGAKFWVPAAMQSKAEALIREAVEYATR